MPTPVAVCSDFGLTDHFAGVMKGVILSINPEAKIVDITHDLPRFNIKHAAFVLHNSRRFFPDGSVFLAVVDPGVGTDRKPLAASAGGKFFVGPDNGIFSEIFRSEPFSAHAIENPEYTLETTGSTFHGRDIFAPAAAHLSLGVKLSDMGGRIENPVMVDTEQPVSFDGSIAHGVAVYVDSFGNLISNIRSDGVPDSAEILVAGFAIQGVSGSYSGRGEGKAVAVRGSTGFIEIAVNRGVASERFGAEGTEIIVRAKE